MTPVCRITKARLPLAVMFLWLVLQPVSAGPLPLAKALPHVQGTRAIVLEQLEILLAKDPALQVVGQGSWLRSGAKAASKAGGVSRPYSDPLLNGAGASDHDLRLAMQGPEEAALGSKFTSLSSAEQALVRARDNAKVTAKWLESQKSLRDGIVKLFPANAEAKAIEQTLLGYGFTAPEAAKISKLGSEEVVKTVLKSVNLYSPPQLVRLVVDEKTAAAAFRELGAIPNLGGKELEGVWGAGSAAATQEFEAGGRLFYNSGGVRTGFVDLVHMSEEYGRYSFGGAANMSLQWAEKAAEAIKTGDLSLVAKYLKRLKGTLVLSVKKGGLRSDALRTTFGNLNQFIAAAETGQAAVLEGGLDLAKFLRTARMQSSVLGELARNSGSIDREIMLAILEAQPASRWDKVGQWFREVWPSAESLAAFERTLQGVFLVYSSWQMGGTWGEKGMEQALRQAGADVTSIVSLPIGALMMLTNSMLDNAKEFGYNSAVKPQEWREFLAGISSVTGYEGMTNLELSIEKLAVTSVSPAEVTRAVELQAYNISRLKDTGAAETDATARARETIKEKLTTNMTPIVLAEWLRERKRLITNYLYLALELDDRMRNLVLSASSTPETILVEKDAPVDASVQLTTRDNVGAIQDLLTRMEAAIRPLGGRQHIVVFSYRGSVTWEQDGRTKEVSTTTNLKDLFAPHAVHFAGPGGYPMSARFKLEVRAPSLGGVDEASDVFVSQPLLARTYERAIPFFVDVIKDELVFREYWDAAKTILKREYAYILEDGHVGGPAKIRQGFERIYYESGKLAYEATRKNDQFEGRMTRYWATGSVFDVAVYKDGDRVGKYAAFHPDGSPRATGQFLGDRKVGAWKTYHDNGKLESDGAYASTSDGAEPIGPSVPAIPLGTRTSTYADKGLYYDWGLQVGPWTIYYPSGRKQADVVFDDEGKTPAKDAKRVSSSRSYYDNAANSLQSESVSSSITRWYENGQMQEQCPATGKCRYWSSDGKEIIRVLSQGRVFQHPVEQHFAGAERRDREDAGDDDAAVGRGDERGLAVHRGAGVDGDDGALSRDRHRIAA